ncbi:MAG: HAD-IB family hydrolase [Bacteroidales bacterium]|nr:HAD-IB family hydrolase [Bacteroidales bacterium]
MGIISSENEKTGHGYLAFFDLDGTITREISGKALAVAAYKKGLMMTSDFANALWLSLLYKLSIRDPLSIIASMMNWIKGLPEKSLEELSAAVFREVLLPSVYSNARDEIRFHKERSAKTVVLSSSISFICREAVKSLGMDDAICTEPEIINGYCTGKPSGAFCFGGEKGARLAEYCETSNYDPSETWFFGDSIHDISALSIVGHPVCVNPEVKLRKTAIRKGWDIKQWL